MLVMEWGNVTVIRDPHEENAPSPMLVTLSGIVTLVRFAHEAKAELAILVTPVATV
jgi:hypothetical protein